MILVDTNVISEPSRAAPHPAVAAWAKQIAAGRLCTRAITEAELLLGVAILPPGRRAVLRRGSWPVPPVFGWLQRLGGVPQAEMDRVFNGGVGFAVVCAPSFADSIVRQLDREGVPAAVIGEVAEGEAGVEIAAGPAAGDGR